MAADFIPVNTAKPFGALAVQTGNLIYQLKSSVTRMVAAANHQNNGADYSMVEQQFGLQAGAGANFVTLLNIMDAIFNGATGAGGATQQGQINEYCARISGQ